MPGSRICPRLSVNEAIHSWLCSCGVDKNGRRHDSVKSFDALTISFFAFLPSVQISIQYFKYISKTENPKY